MDDDLTVPSFLIISREQRAAAWKRCPPKAMPAFHTERETDRAYRASIEYDKALKRAINEQRWAGLREKTKADKTERDEVARAVRRRKR